MLNKFYVYGAYEMRYCAESIGFPYIFDQIENISTNQIGYLYIGYTLQFIYSISAAVLIYKPRRRPKHIASFARWGLI